MSAKPIGLVIPTRWEAAQILKRYDFKKSGDFFQATVEGHPVSILISGVGREAAREAANRLVSEGAKVLVSVGFCGALLPSQKVGDLVTHRIATVDKPVATPEGRRAVAERANAIAVDMETQAVIEAGTLRGVPIFILRVISDEFTDNLLMLFGEGGSFSPVRIAIRLLNPALWPLVVKLKRHSRIAAAKLADELPAFCQRL
jgi:nucleoside phosphorylase